MRDTTPTVALQQVFYDSILKPLLKNEPKGEIYSYLLHCAWEGWTLNFQEAIADPLRRVEALCVELASIDTTYLVSLISEIEPASSKDYTRLQAMPAYEMGKDLGDLPHQVMVETEQYQTLFDSSLRIWLSLPYLRWLQLMNKPIPPAVIDLLAIASGEKFGKLKDAKQVISGVALREYVNEVDSLIRNAAAHSQWEITDDGKVVFPDLDPMTGQLKSRGKEELSMAELGEKLRGIRRVVWTLQTGLSVFLVNNPDIRKQLKRTTPYSIEEIERMIGVKFRNRWLNLSRFAVSPDHAIVELIVQYEPEPVSHSSQVFIGTAAAFDLVNVDFTNRYDDQCYGAVSDVGKCWEHNQWGVPSVSVKVMDDKGVELSQGVFSAQEVGHIRNGVRVAPASGSLTDLTFKSYGQLRVAYGTGAHAQRLVDARNVLAKPLPWAK